MGWDGMGSGGAGEREAAELRECGRKSRSEARLECRGPLRGYLSRLASAKRPFADRPFSTLIRLEGKMAARVCELGFHECLGILSCPSSTSLGNSVTSLHYKITWRRTTPLDPTTNHHRPTTTKQHQAPPATANHHQPKPSPLLTDFRDHVVSFRVGAPPPLQYNLP